MREIRFRARRFDTPHPVIELQEVGGNALWRVKAETIEREPPPPAFTPDASQLQDRTRCRCTHCGKHAARKGGKNINHRFVCANCVGDPLT